MTIGFVVLGLSIWLSIWLTMVLAPADAPTTSTQPLSREALRLRFDDLQALGEQPRSDHESLLRDLRLMPLRGGGYRYTGTPGERFSATIRPDGSVAFDVQAGLLLKLDRVCFGPLCRRTRRSREERDADTAYERTFGRRYGEPAGGPIPGVEGDDPEPRSTDARMLSEKMTELNMQGRFGHLRAPIASMRAFLERTSQLRFEMAERATLQRLDAHLRELPQRLAVLWNEDVPAPRRRAALLALWSEFDDGTPPATEHESRVDARRRQAAIQARAKILEFVRRFAPPGSPDAFTREELEAYNRRSGVAAFWPYREHEQSRR